ncbi:MAG: hypothetical protein ACK4WH_00045 [Phycisphaerales bacterium]
MLAGATTLDDRGRAVAVIYPSSLAVGSSDLDRAPIMARFLRGVIRAESERITPGRVVLGVVVCIVLLVISSWVRRAIPGAPPMTGVAVFVGGLIAMALVSRAQTRQTHGGLLSATAVSAGLCGSCGYSLGNLSAEPDGCLVCPECGAAWRACRVTRPHWAVVGDPFAPRERSPRVLRWLGLLPADRVLLGPDARGAYFRMIDRHLYLLPRSARQTLGPERCAKLRRAVGRIGLIRRVLTALLPLALGLRLIILAFWESRGTAPMGRTESALLLFLAGTLVLATVGVIRGHLFCRNDRRGAMMASLGVCGACGDELAGLPVQADGLVTCGGCGAGWRPRGEPFHAVLTEQDREFTGTIIPGESPS